MKKSIVFYALSFILGIIFLLLVDYTGKKTSTSEYCISCHAHPHADQSWTQSTHYLTPTAGMRVECVQCHLPPKGDGYWPQKIKMGVRDVYSHYFKDSASINWEAKQLVENAVKYIPESACLQCHSVLFPPKLSKEGEEAHLYYKMKKDEVGLHCINCHLQVGHYKEGAEHGHNQGFGTTSVPVSKEKYQSSAMVTGLQNYTETIPGTNASFKMIALKGGSFILGSTVDEPYRDTDEGPQVEVNLSPFFMAEIEVTWDEYMAFYLETGKEGRTTDTDVHKVTAEMGVDGISGPTPPYGLPDRGWGMGQRPAISMSYHAVETYCQWLSEKTGKTYRLPTEAEWEYAARGGTSTPYYFSGDPLKFQKKGLASKLGKNETEPIQNYEFYADNAMAKTHLPDEVDANPFGLKNMLGNVSEFCADYYSEDQFSKYTDGIKNPTGPVNGLEHVVRGGSYLSAAGELRSAVRSSTKTSEWLRTDPQMPKSIWWYSDCFYVGFRVVCEFDEKTGNSTVVTP